MENFPVSNDKVPYEFLIVIDENQLLIFGSVFETPLVVDDVVPWTCHTIVLETFPYGKTNRSTHSDGATFRDERPEIASSYHTFNILRIVIIYSKMKKY